MTNIKKNIAVILGARPNFIKAAPFFLQAKKYPEFKFTIIHTGQHFDSNMSKVFFTEMAIPQPDINLKMKGQYHTEKIGNMFNSLKEVFANYKFDAAIVFGDVNTTLAGALAAVKGNCKLIHVESGLRSHDRRMPEEIHRVTVDHLSHLLFTTEPSANENLRREGIEENKIKYVGNIMINSLEFFKEKINQSNIISNLQLGEKKYVTATVHRQENTDNLSVLRHILLLLNEINKIFRVVFPLHPGTKNNINNFNLQYLLKDLYIIEPLGYLDFMKLVMGSKGIITDSGGIQEETTHLGVPCCTLRDNTERPITIEKGSNKLISIDLKNLDEIIAHIMREDFSSGHIPLWDGKVSERILKILREEIL